MTKNVIKRLLIIFAIVAMVINAITISSFAINSEKIETRDLKYEGDCGDLLRRRGIKIKTAIVLYEQNGKKYPAYCLDTNKVGVNEKLSYSVKITSVLKDAKIWRTIINGYPYKTVEELGCKSIGEAFMATKMAVYASLYNYNLDEFTSIGEAGERTLNALKNIVKKANSSNEVQISTQVNIVEDADGWKANKKDKNYISKICEVITEAPMSQYEIIKEKATEGTKITDLENKEKSTFKSGEKFMVSIPFAELKSDGQIKVKIKTKVNTKPILVGFPENSNNQEYAITGASLEDTEGEKTLKYNKNETKIKILKADETGKNYLKNAIFQLLDRNKNVIISEIKTDEKGEATLNNILPGTYYLREIASPDGYIKYDKDIEISPKFNEELTVTLKNKKGEDPKIEYEKTNLQYESQAKEVMVKLPKTGM